MKRFMTKPANRTHKSSPGFASLLVVTSVGIALLIMLISMYRNTVDAHAVLLELVEFGRRLQVFAVLVLRPLEHHVLEQVSESAATGALVLGAHVVPGIHGNDGRLVIFMDNQRQAVV